jgi:hypothetical protein
MSFSRPYFLKNEESRSFHSVSKLNAGPTSHGQISVHMTLSIAKAFGAMIGALETHDVSLSKSAFIIELRKPKITPPNMHPSPTTKVRTPKGIAVAGCLILAVMHPNTLAIITGTAATTKVIENYFKPIGNLTPTST